MNIFADIDELITKTDLPEHNKLELSSVSIASPLPWALIRDYKLQQTFQVEGTACDYASSRSLVSFDCSAPPNVVRIQLKHTF